MRSGEPMTPDEQSESRAIFEQRRRPGVVTRDDPWSGDDPQAFGIEDIPQDNNRQ